MDMGREKDGSMEAWKDVDLYREIGIDISRYCSLDIDFGTGDRSSGKRSMIWLWYPDVPVSLPSVADDLR